MQKVVCKEAHHSFFTAHFIILTAHNRDKITPNNPLNNMTFSVFYVVSNPHPHYIKSAIKIYNLHN